MRFLLSLRVEQLLFLDKAFSKVVFRVFWGQHHEALLPFVFLGLYFLCTEVFPIAFCGFQAPGVAEGLIKMFCACFLL